MNDGACGWDGTTKRIGAAVAPPGTAEISVGLGELTFALGSDLPLLSQLPQALQCTVSASPHASCQLYGAQLDRGALDSDPDPAGYPVNMVDPARIRMDPVRIRMDPVRIRPDSKILDPVHPYNWILALGPGG